VDLDAEHRSLVRSPQASGGAKPCPPLRRGLIWILLRSEVLVRGFRWNLAPSFAFSNPSEEFMEAIMGRGILLWLLGVPIPVIILLWLFFGR
jgi:hypothetical protein